MVAAATKHIYVFARATTGRAAGGQQGWGEQGIKGAGEQAGRRVGGQCGREKGGWGRRRIIKQWLP